MRTFKGLLWLALAAPALALGANREEANRQLFQSLASQDPETALYALSEGADPMAREPDGTTPLHYAAHYADIRLITALLKAKADPNAKNQFGSMPLAEAATTGNAEAIRLLLKAGANVESPNAEGQTALMVVARAGKLDAAKLLLKSGADVNAKEGWAHQSAPDVGECREPARDDPPAAEIRREGERAGCHPRLGPTQHFRAASQGHEPWRLHAHAVCRARRLRPLREGTAGRRRRHRPGGPPTRRLRWSSRC